MSQNIQTFEIVKGEDLLLDFSPSTGTTDISSYSLIFEAKRKDKQSSAAVDISKTTSSGISFTSTTNFRVTVASANTSDLRSGVYNWEVWRTDSSNRRRLAFGQFDLLNTIRDF